MKPKPIWSAIPYGNNDGIQMHREVVTELAADATHLRLTVGSALNSFGGVCALYYPYGSAKIGRDDAVTDNVSFIAKPFGWDIGADLGSAWNLDFSPAATTAPIVPSNMP